jgi:predicted AAA+ superfamily ATPase
MQFKRLLDLDALLMRKSFFLLGPRATGKSWLIRNALGSKATVIDLLRGDHFLRLTSSPSDLESMVTGAEAAAGKRPVVIDEIQRAPELLNEVHRLIEERGLRFVLTGSSARKLRSGSVNLLGGRAWSAELLPLTSREIPHFDLARYLRYGGLPPVQLSAEPEEELAAYVHTYLQEEVRAEGLVRKLPQFSRFLTTAALANGQILNFAAVGSDAGMAASTVREHYAILVDTLVGFMLEPWTKSRKRKAVSTGKFYFFDPGVVHTLAGTRTLDRNSDLYGRSFEQFVGMELRAWLSYRRVREPLCFWRSTHAHEVDFIVGDRLAIETKAARRIAPRDLRGLRALGDEGKVRERILVSHDPVVATREGIRCLPWAQFLDALWADEWI